MARGVPPRGILKGLACSNHPSPTRGRHSIGPVLHAAPSTNHHHNLMPTLAPSFVAIRRVANRRPSCRVHCLACRYAPSAIRPLRCAPLPSLGPASPVPSSAPTSLDTAASWLSSVVSWLYCAFLYGIPFISFRFIMIDSSWVFNWFDFEF